MPSDKQLLWFVAFTDCTDSQNKGPKIRGILKEK